MAKEIKFNIRLNIDGKEQLVTATTGIKEISEAANACRSRLGEMNDLLVNFNQKIEKYKNIADSISQVLNGLRDTARQGMAITQLTGETGDAMRSLRSEVSAVAEYYGKGFDEVLRSANALSKGFGVGMDEAMRLVRDGFAAGADAGGDFLDTVREYPRYFKEAGMSAEDFIAISTNAARQGVFSDKGVDAIKEANIRLREMTPATQAALEGIGMSAEAVQQALRDGSSTTFQVIQQVAARLGELPASSAEVGAALADIFGGPGEDAGLEYIKTLADVELSMERVKAGAGEVAEAQDGQVAAIERVKNALTGIVDFSGLYNMAAPFITMAEKAGNATVTVLALANALKSLNAASRLRSLLQLGAFLPRLVANSRRAAAAMHVLANANRSAATATAAVAAKVAIRGLLSATVVGAAIAALGFVIEKLVGAFSSAGDAAEDAAGKMEDFKDGADTVRQAYDTTLKSTYSGLMSKYEALRSEWKRLSDEHAKNDWIRQNQGAFEELRLKIKGVSDAEGIFSGNTDRVAEAFMARAKAAAYAAKATSLYEKHVQLTESRDAIAKGIADDARRNGRNARAGDVIPEGWRDERYGSVDRQGVWRFSESGAKLYSGTDVTSNAQWQQAQRAIEANQREIDKTREMVEALNKESSQAISPGTGERATTPTATPTTTTAAPTAAAPSYEVGSVSWYEGRIRELERRIGSTADVGAAKAILPDLTMARAGLHDLKVRIGLEDPAQPVAIARSVNEQLQAEIKPIEIPVDTGGLDKGRHSIEGATEALRSLGGALSSAGSNIELPALDVAGTIASAIATTIMGFAQASSKESKLGVWGWIAASVAGLANLMAVVGSIKAMGAFADGGVVSGPTLALVGEYAGAGSNPEVIAPLDRLRSMLNPPVAASLGAVRFEVEGRKLVGVMANETRTAAKSGRRTNIRI